MSANKILEGPWWDVVVVAVVVVVPQVFQHLPTPDVLTHRLLAFSSSVAFFGYVYPSSSVMAVVILLFLLLLLLLPL